MNLKQIKNLTENAQATKSQIDAEYLQKQTSIFEYLIEREAKKGLTECTLTVVENEYALLSPYFKSLILKGFVVQTGPVKWSLRSIHVSWK